MRIKEQIDSILVSLLLTFCLLVLPVTAFGEEGRQDTSNDGMQLRSSSAMGESRPGVYAGGGCRSRRMWIINSIFGARASMLRRRLCSRDARWPSNSDFVGAYNAFRQAYGYDPVNELAVSEMERMLRLQSVKEGTSEQAATATAITRMRENLVTRTMTPASGRRRRRLCRQRAPNSCA